jgi:hypothetical protein
MSELFYIPNVHKWFIQWKQKHKYNKVHCVQESTEKCMVILLLIIFVFPGMY